MNSRTGSLRIVPWATLLASCALSATAAAQATNLQSPRSLNFHNRSSYARNEYAVATIPFKKGEYFGEPDIYDAVSGNPVFVRPFGRTYGDGSYRHAEAILRVQVPEAFDPNVPIMANYPLTVGASAPYTAPFTEGPNTAALATFPAPFNALHLQVTINGATMTCDLQAAAGTPFGAQSIIDEGPRRTMRFIERPTGSDFVYTLYVYKYSGEDYLTWELRITNSGHVEGGAAGSPTGTNQYTSSSHDAFLSTWMNVDLCMYGEDGHVSLAESGGYPGTGYVGQTRVGHRATLSNGAQGFFNVPSVFLQGYTLSTSAQPWGDGQSQVWRGSLLVPAWDPATLEASYSNEMYGNLVHPLIGMSPDWRGTEAFGPQGFIAPGSVSATEINQKFTGYWDWLRRASPSGPADLWERYVQGPALNDYIGLQPDNSAQGEQPDFGILEGWDVFASADPRLAEAYGYLGYHSTRRSIHRYHGPNESTNSQILHVTETSHPGMYNDPENVLLYFLQAYHPNSQTTLGKTVGPHLRNGWSGFKMSHISLNHLFTGYILNPWSRTLEEQLDFCKEAWMNQFPDPALLEPPARSTSFNTLLRRFGETREIGRGYFAMTQIAIARGLHEYGPRDLLGRLDARTSRSILREGEVQKPSNSQPWPPERKTMYGFQVDPANLLSIYKRDSSTGGLYNLHAQGTSPALTVFTGFPHYNPWEHALAPYGLFAAEKLAGEDSQISTLPFPEHGLAARLMANSAAAHSVFWDSTDPSSFFASYPSTTTGQSATKLSALSTALPGTPQRWGRIGYRVAFETNAAGYALAPLASDVARKWKFEWAGAGLTRWASPTFYLLGEGLIQHMPGLDSDIPAAVIEQVDGDAEYARRWQWGQ